MVAGLVLIFAHGADQLAQVVPAGLVGFRVLAVQLLGKPGFVQHMGDEIRQPHVLLLGGQAEHEFCKGADAAAGAGGKGLRRVGQDAEQRHLLPGGLGFQLGDGGVADGALGGVDDALERYGVRGVHDHAKVGQGVLDLPSVIEAGAAEHPVGKARADEHFFDDTALGVGAVEHRHFPVGHAALGQLADPFADPGGLVPLVPGGIELDLFARRRLRPKDLFLSSLVVGDHLVGGVQDVGGGAVVLLQLDDLDVVKVLLKFQNVADVRPAPAVDGLVVVAHHAEVAGNVGQKADKLVLHVVRVLIFVHQDVLELPLVIFQYRRMVHKQLEGLGQQVVKVQGAVFHQRLVVGAEYVVQELGAAAFVGLGEPFVRGQKLILGAGNFPADFLGGQVFIVDVELFVQVLDDPELVVVVVDGERALVAELLDIPP